MKTVEIQVPGYSVKARVNRVPASVSKRWPREFGQIARAEKLRIAKLKKDGIEVPDGYETDEYVEAQLTWAEAVVRDVEAVALVDEDADAFFERLMPAEFVIFGLAVMREVGALPNKFRVAAESGGEQTE